MARATELFDVWKKIYRKPSYILAALLIAFVFYLVNVVIQHQNYNSILEFYVTAGFAETLVFFFTLALGLYVTMTLSSFVSLIITAVLIGMLFTLITYKTTALKTTHRAGNKKQGVVASVGIFLGIAAPGCAACGVGLLAFFGIGASVLASLPLHGLEVALLAMVVLIISIVYISKGLLECRTCKIHLDKELQ